MGPAELGKSARWAIRWGLALTLFAALSAPVLSAQAGQGVPTDRGDETSVIGCLLLDPFGNYILTTETIETVERPGLPVAPVGTSGVATIQTTITSTRTVVTVLKLAEKPLSCYLLKYLLQKVHVTGALVAPGSGTPGAVGTAGVVGATGNERPGEYRLKVGSVKMVSMTCS